MKEKVKTAALLLVLLAAMLPAAELAALDPGEIDKAAAEGAEKALAELGISTGDGGPSIIDRMQSTVLDMPPVKENAVLWQTKMKDYAIQDLRFIAPNRLLLTQSSSTPLLVDSRTGQVLWTYLPMGWTITYYDLVAAFSDLILIREDDQRDGLTTLAAMDGETGKQRWHTQFENKKRTFQFLPVPEAGVVLVLDIEKSRVTMTALGLMDGARKWEQTYKIQKGGHPTPPVITARDAWSFYGHTERLDPASGKTLWQRKDVAPDNLSPLPVLAGGRLHVIDDRKTLHVLNPDTGETVLTAPLDGKTRYTNIHPVGGDLYLRGQDASDAWFLARHDGRTGQAAWTYRSTQATVSNIIQDGDRVYAATAAKVLCLDRNTGRELFSASATLTGQSFPVRLRKYGSTVVYIGELVIAGFDAATGKRGYFVGMTPVSQEAHLDALDNWMSVLQKRIGRLSKAMWFGGAGGAGDAFSSMAVSSQNLSNNYAGQAATYRLRASSPYNSSASSDGWKAADLQNRSRMNSSFSRTEAQLGFFFQMEGLKNAMLSKSIARDQDELSRLDAIRRKILGAYTASESDDYTWRAHVEGDWIGLNLVHLPTGRTTFTPFSPLIKARDDAEYNERSLWNLVDVETGTVYHPALRTVEERYQQKTKEGVVTYGIRLVAEKVKMK
ncbi:MAG: PQQ-binding-like beta-propeller repeat protein [bacterium]|nr:MAG: PQQ-binding-like beta-propeller repeat protein [bacterium]